MTRFALIAVGLMAFPIVARAADEAKGEKAAHTVYDAYFEKNNSGLKGDATYTALTSKDGFEKVFAARPPLMGGKKPVLLAPDAFDKHFVAAVIKRGPAITTYKVEAVTLDKDGILYVQYKAESGPAGTATFASPLIVSVPKEGAKKVTFIENGKAVSTVDVK
ncbi:unnamed protein product [Gemmata massiliana]|uniref:Uncharacterized protein n=1 Tax=Gemmata massiliana TaxID=1210884 RepID=A0A6P2CTM5_9BACT|nr:hypothetical protein [Gemmata massiliana]VTR92253.1 unnamed protein product [Gemmata massiliana]